MLLFVLFVSYAKGRRRLRGWLATPPEMNDGDPPVRDDLRGGLVQ